MSQNAFVTQFAYLPGIGYAASGIYLADSTSKPAVRFSTTAAGLATAPDIVLPSSDESINSCFALGGLFIVADTLGGIWSSADGETWHQANNVGADWPIGTTQGGVYDDINDKIILITGTFNVITAVPGPGALTFTSHQWATPGGDTLAAIGYRPGSGITNAITESGGSTSGDTYKSTDGGGTWVLTNSRIFSDNNSFQIAYTGTSGTTVWSAFGGDSVGTLCNSHANDGDSWTAPSAWGGPTLPGTITFDASGNPVYWTDSSLWKSTDAGVTWTEIASGGLPANDGGSAFGFTWDGHLWAICLLSPDDSASFFVTSPDLVTWTQGPNIVDAGSSGNVPNVVGDSLHTAASVITTAAFVVGTVTIESSSNAVDTIVSQSPAAGTSASLGTPVNVVVSTGTTVVIHKLTQKLLLYLHRIFDKDPYQKLAFRIQYDGSDLSWSIFNGILTLTATGGTGTSYTFNISNFVIGDLADFIDALPGYSVPYQDTSGYALLSALALLDQSNDINTSNGDHVYGYTTLLWAWMDSNSSELGTAKLQIGNALQQMNTSSAQDEWLDYHGTFYNVPRQQNELDPNYSPRMIASVLQPRGNNVAIAMAIQAIALGAQRVRVIDAIDDTSFAITYDGLIEYNGAEFFDAGLGVNGAYGFFDVDFSFDFSGSVTQDTYFAQILTTVQAFRDGGTQLRAVIFRNNGSTTTIISDSFVNGIRVIVYDDFTGETFRMLEDGTTRFEEDGTARILES